MVQFAGHGSKGTAVAGRSPTRRRLLPPLRLFAGSVLHALMHTKQQGKAKRAPRSMTSSYK